MMEAEFFLTYVDLQGRENLKSRVDLRVKSRGRKKTSKAENVSRSLGLVSVSSPQNLASVSDHCASNPGRDIAAMWEKLRVAANM